MSYTGNLIRPNSWRKHTVHRIVLAPIEQVGTSEDTDKLNVKGLGGEEGGLHRPLLDFEDVYMSSGRAILRQIELCNGSNKDVTVNLSWHQLEDQTTTGAGLYSMRIEFQLENPNLQYKYGSPKYNEALNLAGFVSVCHVPAMGSTKVVVVCHPHIDSAKSRERNFQQRWKGNDDSNSVTLSVTTSSTISSLALPTESFQVIEGQLIAEGEGIRASSTLIRARVCNSVMTRYVKEFSVWNRSQIHLVFHISSSACLVEDPGVLECYDYDTQKSLLAAPSNGGSSQGYHRLSAFAHMRVRVVFRPTRECVHNYCLFLDNANDPRNRIILDISTSATHTIGPDKLVIEMQEGETLRRGSVVRMGDLYSGLCTRRPFQLRNATRKPMKVCLYCSHQDEVKFEEALDESVSTVAPRGVIRRGGADGTATQGEKEDLEGDGANSKGSVADFNISGLEPNVDLRSQKHGEVQDEEEDEEEEEEEEEDDEEGVDGEGGGPLDSLAVNKDGNFGPLRDRQRKIKLETPHMEREWPFGGSSEDEEVDGGGYSFTAQPLRSQVPKGGAYGSSRNDRKAEREAHKASRVDSLADTRFLDVEELSLPPGQTKTIYVSLTPLERVPEYYTASILCGTSSTTQRSSLTDSRTGAEHVTSSVNMIATRQRENACLQPRVYRLLFHFSEHEAEDPLTQTRSQAMRLVHPRAGEGNQDFHSLSFGPANDPSICIPVVLRARVCTSLLSVSPEVVPFGECQIGEYKSANVTITNLSDLPAVATQQLTSKTLSCRTSTLSIPPHSSADLKLEYVPHKITSAYRKTIRVVNCMNTLGDVTIQVQASNVDTDDILLHSAFYKVHVNNKMKQQQVYFKRAILNCPTIQAFHIKNIANQKLCFELSTSSPDEVQLYKITYGGGSSSQGLSTPRSSSIQDFSPLSQSSEKSKRCCSTSKRHFPEKVDTTTRSNSERHLEATTASESSSSSNRNRSIILTSNSQGGGGRLRSRSFNDEMRVKSSPNLVDPDPNSGDSMITGAAAVKSNILPSFITRSPHNVLSSLGGSSNSQSSNGMMASSTDIVNDSKKSPKRRSPTESALQLERNKSQELPSDAILEKLQYFPLNLNMPSLYSSRPLFLTHPVVEGSSYSSTVISLDLEDNSRLKNEKRPPDYVALSELLDLFHVKVTHSEMQILQSSGGFSAAAAANSGNNVNRNGSCDAVAVENMQRKQNLLERVISSGALTLVTQNNVVTLRAGEEVSIIVVLRLASGVTDHQVKGPPPGQSSGTTTVARNIHIRLLDVNSKCTPFSLSQFLGARPQSHPTAVARKGAISGGFTTCPDTRQMRQPLQVRSLLIRAKAFRSEMFVVQKNINFGRVAVMDFATKSVFVENRATVPLLYSISKSGSISSEFLQIPQGGSGVVPPHGSVEIQFVFRPSLAGPFEEMLSVINVCDSNNTQIITIKARVFQPEPFALVDPPPQLSFGPCLVGALEYPPTVIVRLSNTTNRRRYLVVQGIGSYENAGGVQESSMSTSQASESNGNVKIVRPYSPSGHSSASSPHSSSSSSPFSPIFTFVVEVQGAQAAIPREERQHMEDRLEHYLFKLRIAERKEKFAKVTKLRSRVDRLVRKLNGEDLGQAGDDISESESDSDVETAWLKGSSDRSNVSNMATFILGAGCTVSISVSLAFIPGPSGLAGWRGSILFNGAVLFYESRNTDIVKELPCSANVISSTAEYNQALFGVGVLNTASPSSDVEANKTVRSSRLSISTGEDAAAAAAAAGMISEENERSGDRDGEDQSPQGNSTTSIALLSNNNYSGGRSKSYITSTSTTINGEDIEKPLNTGRLSSQGSSSFLLQFRDGVDSSPQSTATTTTTLYSDTTLNDFNNHTFLITIPQHCLVQHNHLLRYMSLLHGENWKGDEIHETGIHITAAVTTSSNMSDTGAAAVTPSFTVHSSVNVDTIIEISWVGNEKGEQQNIGLHVGLKSGNKKPSTTIIPRTIGRGGGDAGNNSNSDNTVNATSGGMMSSNWNDSPFGLTSLLAVLRPDASLEVALSYIGSEEHVNKMVEILPRIIGYVNICALKDNGGIGSDDTTTTTNDGSCCYLSPLCSTTTTTTTKEFKHRTILPVLLESPPESWLQVPSRLDLGDVKLGYSVMSSFSIHNANPSAPVKYVIMCAKTTSSESNPVSLTGAKSGEVEPGSTDNIMVNALGTKVGRASREVVICNLNNRRQKLKVRVTFTVKPLLYLVFPDHPIDEEGRLKQINVGNCYVPRFVDDSPRDTQAILRPLRVVNISDRQLFLTVVSNLRKQCYVYSSSSADKGTEVWEYTFPPKTEVIFYLGLRPVLPLEARAAGDTRELIGGLRFLGFSKTLQQLDAMRGSSNEERDDDDAMNTTTTTKQQQQQLSSSSSSSSYLKGRKGEEKNACTPTDDNSASTIAIHKSQQPYEGGNLATDERNVEDDALHLERIETDLLEYKLFESSVRFVSVVGSSILKLNPTDFPTGNVVIPYDSPFSTTTSTCTSSTLLNATMKTFGGGTNVSGDVSTTVTRGTAEWEGITVLYGTFSVINGSRGLPLRYEFPKSQYCATTLDEALKIIRMGKAPIQNSHDRLPETISTTDPGAAAFDSQSQQLLSSDESKSITKTTATFPSFVRLFVLGSRVGDLPPLSSAVVSFVVILRQWWGLFERAVKIVSQDDPAQVQSIQIQLVVQDGTVSISQEADVVAGTANHSNIHDDEPAEAYVVQGGGGGAARMGFLDSLGNTILPPPTIDLPCPVCISCKGTENDCCGKMLPFRVVAEDAWECFLEKSQGYGTTSFTIQLHNIAISRATTPLYAYSNLPISLQLPAEDSNERCSSTVVNVVSEETQYLNNGGAVGPMDPTATTNTLREDHNCLMRRCSGPLLLPSSTLSTLDIKVTFPPGGTTACLPLEAVQRGQVIPFQGCVAFASSDGPVKALLRVTGKYCLPQIDVVSPLFSCDPPVMQLGVMGYSQLSPVSIPVHFQIENRCNLRVPVTLPGGPIKLTPVNASLQPEINALLVPKSTSPMWLEPLSTSDVDLFIGLCVEDTEVCVGQHSLSFALHTLNEALCSIGGREVEMIGASGELVINASIPIMTQMIQISRGITKCYEPYVHYEMVIDGIDVPSPPSTPPIQAAFTVENVYSEPIYVTIEVSSNGGGEDGGSEGMEVVELEALSSVPSSFSIASSSLPRDDSDTKVFVRPGEVTGIFIIARARHGARLSEQYARLDGVSSSSPQTAVKVGEVLLSCSLATTISKDGVAGGGGTTNLRDDDGEGGGAKRNEGINTSSTRVILVEKVEVYAPLRLGPFLNLSATDIELLLPAIDETHLSQHQHQMPLSSFSIPSCFSVENFSPSQVVRFMVRAREDSGTTSVGDAGRGDTPTTLSFKITPTHGTVKPLGCTVITLQLTKDCCDAFIKQKFAELQTCGRGQSDHHLGCYILLLSDEDFPYYPYLKVRVTPTAQERSLPILSQRSWEVINKPLHRSLSDPLGIDEVVVHGTRGSSKDPALQRLGSSKYGFVENGHKRDSSSTNSGPLLPVLDLGGCTPVSRSTSIFDINLGQQVVQPDGYCGQWELSLIAPPSNTGNVTFKLSLLHDSDAEWLTLGMSSGILAPGEQVNSTLFLEQSRVGIFDTYLTCSNIENPKDLKVIRVRMQVVLDGDKSSAIGRGGTFNADSLFHVSVPPVAKREILPTVDFGPIICCGRHERSFLIQNFSPIPLEFRLSSTLPQYILDFSIQGGYSYDTSCSTGKFFIRSESFEFIFLRLRPNKKEDIDARVYVTCWLVKDYQFAVRILATVIMPQLSIHDIRDEGEADDNGEIVCEMGKEEEEEEGITAAVATIPRHLETMLQFVYTATPESEVTTAAACKQKHIIVTNVDSHTSVTCVLRCLTKRFVVQLEKLPPSQPPHSNHLDINNNNNIESSSSSTLGLVGLGFESGENSSFCLSPGEKAILHIDTNLHELELSDELENVSTNDQGNDGGSGRMVTHHGSSFIEGLIHLYNAAQPVEKHKILLRVYLGGGNLDLSSPKRTTQELPFHGVPSFYCPVRFSCSIFRYIETCTTKFIQSYDMALMHFLAAIFQDSSSLPLQSTTNLRDKVSSSCGGGGGSSGSSSSPVVIREDTSNNTSQVLLQQLPPIRFSCLQLKILTEALDSDNHNSDNFPDGGTKQQLYHPTPSTKEYRIPGNGNQGIITTVREQCDKLVFDLIFLTDMLLGVMLSRSLFSCGANFNVPLSCPIVNLASLLYSVVVRHPICSAYVHQQQMRPGNLHTQSSSQVQPHVQGQGQMTSVQPPRVLKRLACELDRFLSYFPQAFPGFEPLIELHQEASATFYENKSSSYSRNEVE